MIRSLRAALFAALTLLAAVPSSAGEHQLGYADALAQAKESGKVVVIDFFADWCGPCKAFDRDLANAESGIAAALDAVVFTSIDAEKGEGIELAKKYGVTGYPTYTMMNAEGELIEGWIGYGGPEWYIDALTTALADPTTFDQKKERFATNPTAKDAEALGRIAAASGQSADAMAYLEKAEQLDPTLDVTEQYLDAAFTRARLDPDYGWPDYIAVAKERVLEADANASATLYATYYVGRATKDEADHATVKPFLEKSRKTIAAGAGDVPQALIEIVELDAIMYLDGDMEAAVAYKRSNMPEGWQQDADQLNSFAWWCFEHNVNLEEAQKLALEGVKLAEPGKARAQILDTAAEICNALGNCDEAVALIKQALEQDPTSEYYAEQLTRFEEAAAE